MEKNRSIFSKRPFVMTYLWNFNGTFRWFVGPLTRAYNYLSRCIHGRWLVYYRDQSLGEVKFKYFRNFDVMWKFVEDCPFFVDWFEV